MRTRTLPLGARTLLVGIVNVTPDSFSDGGLHAATEGAIEHALRLLREGADILDIGGESTRPGSPAATPQAIDASQEQDRVLPVIEGILLARPDSIISVDTYRAATARAAVLAGAEIVNDVSGMLWDRAMATTCAELGCGVIATHTRGLPSEWAAQEPLTDVVNTVAREMAARIQALLRAGIEHDRIALDPGFGFGKRGTENWSLLRGLPTLQALGYPLLIGLSRKGFLNDAAVAAGLPPFAAAQRDRLTHAADVAAILYGAHILRVHDVSGAAAARAIADAVLTKD